MKRINPAFRFRAFLALVSEGVWPRCTGGRLHRNLVRHGKWVSHEPFGRDAWQRDGGLWPANEAQATEWASRPLCSYPTDDLPF